MKLTKEYLESLIENVEYVHPKDSKCFTACFLTIKTNNKDMSPFIIVGKSSCMYEKDFDEEIGKTIAYNDAFNQMWQLVGFLKHF